MPGGVVAGPQILGCSAVLVKPCLRKRPSRVNRCRDCLPDWAEVPTVPKLPVELALFAAIRDSAGPVVIMRCPEFI
jgi:hypothetical protein